jgi:hypothetical protein
MLLHWHHLKQGVNRKHLYIGEKHFIIAFGCGTAMKIGQFSSIAIGGDTIHSF